MSFARGSTGAELLKTSVLAEDAVAELGLVSAKAQVMANHHVHVVPVVLALANPPWQRDVWLDPSAFENIDHVFPYLQAPAWPEVVAIAGRLAQVMVSNDLRLLSCGQHA
ncbi:hypothetical protein ABT142_14295 [Streptomyces sp. NPDC001857]|uniref:hypothetical protein n=1 Tax=unclassified Streptomyces TaxID=2593676 RepID=UPI0033236E16